MNSVNRSLCLMKPTDSICCTSILLLPTDHSLVVFIFLSPPITRFTTMEFVCHAIKGLLTYLLTFSWDPSHLSVYYRRVLKMSLKDNVTN